MNNRNILVVNNGWIFAGDLVDHKDDNGVARVTLTNAVWVFRWERIGFNGVIENPNDSNVDIRPIADVDVPLRSEVFRVPVADGWGVKG